METRFAVVHPFDDSRWTIKLFAFIVEIEFYNHRILKKRSA